MGTADLRERVLSAQRPLTPHATHVWRAAFSSIAPRAGEFQSVLSPDERARAERFRFPEHRDAFIAGRALLRVVLGAYCGCAPDDLRFAYGDQQKPRIDPAAHLPSATVAFNLSHSRTEMQIAVTGGKPVGIDVEDAGRDFDLEGLIAECLTEDESKQLSHSPQRRSEFIRYWVHKEAFLKCIGTGFSVPPNEVQVTFDEDGKSEMHCTNSLAATVLYGRDLDCAPGHRAAIACADPEFVVHPIVL